MLEFEKAVEITEQHQLDSGTEVIDFTDTLGRVLAEDIQSDIDMPPFDKTAVDGFACRKEDLGEELRIIETIPAGKVPGHSIGKGECARIMTGAALPEGADWVFMVEDAAVKDGSVRFTGKAGKDNIARKAEDIRTGDLVLTAGRIIRPQDIAVLATVGAVKVRVSSKPKIAVISTGDELVEPGDFPDVSQIRNSNGYQLIAQVVRTGAEAYYYGIASDDEEHTYLLVTKAIRECDIVLLTGGVSMGDFDFVPGVLKKAGVDIIFDRVAVQPGKPTTFGVHKDAVVFGLPGNPVSSFVQFELFVKPMIHRSMNSVWTPEKLSLPLATDYRRRRSGRMAWIPVRLNDEGEVVPVDYHGSAHINALPDAWGIMSIPLGVDTIIKGEEVDVRQI